jgi:hypothetical protein
MRSQGTGAAFAATRTSRLTDIGPEKRCLTCGEYWPADLEFFDPAKSTRDRLSMRCVACIKEKNWSPACLGTR